MQTDNALFANREPPTVCKQTEHRTRSLVPAFTRCIHGRRGRPLRRHRRETQTQLLTPWQRRRNADKQAFPIREYETRSRSREHVGVSRVVGLLGTAARGHMPAAKIVCLQTDILRCPCANRHVDKPLRARSEGCVPVCKQAPLCLQTGTFTNSA